MRETRRLFIDILMKKSRSEILAETQKLIDNRFASRIEDMQLFARIAYASILSSYIRARTWGVKVGIVLPELEAITKALYSISSTKRNKQGSFEPSKAFEVAGALKLSYRIPIAPKNNILTYILTFSINHPILIALEEGEVSWENMEQSRIIKLLFSALDTISERSGGGSNISKEKKLTRRVARPAEQVISKAIRSIKDGSFKLINNKRPYHNILVSNLVQQKDFINILLK